MEAEGSRMLETEVPFFKQSDFTEDFPSCYKKSAYE